MNIVTANDLKTKGISVVESHLKDDDELVISIRGQSRYVIVDIEKYEKLREYELTVALLEAKADTANGHFVIESVAEHMQRVVGDV
jgi:hypothetical protein